LLAEHSRAVHRFVNKLVAIPAEDAPRPGAAGRPVEGRRPVPLVESARDL
jgi:hypothetical protein